MMTHARTHIFFKKKKYRLKMIFNRKHHHLAMLYNADSLAHISRPFSRQFYFRFFMRECVSFRRHFIDSIKQETEKKKLLSPDMNLQKRLKRALPMMWPLHRLFVSEYVMNLL